MFHIILYLAVLYVFWFRIQYQIFKKVYIRQKRTKKSKKRIKRLTRTKYLRDVINIEKGESKENADTYTTKNMN